MDIWVIEYKEPDETVWRVAHDHELSENVLLDWIERTKVRQATVEGDVTEYRTARYRRVE